MKKGFFLCLLGFAIHLVSAVNAADMKAINFTQKGEVSELEFLFDANDVQASKFQIKEDKQIIIDFADVKASERVMRAFDTSQFTGGIVFVKAYKKAKSSKDIRVAIQLRDNVRSVLVRSTKRIVLQIENRYGVFTQKKVEENQSYKEKNAEAMTSQMGKFNIPKSDSVEDILENITLSGRKKYVGKKISMNLKSIKPDEILKMIAETSGFNIVVTEDIKKLEPISLNLTDVPWDQALDTVLQMGKLVGKKNGIILLVTTFDQAVRENEADKKIRDSLIELDPLVTKIFPISFASITELQKILQEYSSDSLTPGLGGKRGKISIDSRTNSLIVKDTVDVIERIKKIIELLDAQTPQVLIESKIVEVSERYSKEIGLDQGIGFGYDPFSASAQAGTNNGSFSFSTAPDSTKALFGLTVGRLNKLINLDFKLKLMESESKGKVVSSPKIITKNNEPARITQDESSYYIDSVTTTTATGPTTQNTWKSQTTNLSLEVTPQVTNEGSISLKVNLSKGSLSPSGQPNSPQGETKRNVSTNVLVDNGATVVIGGIYSYASSENHSGVPFLKDIPLVGWLFRTKYNPDTIKRELIIFLTPRIINQEEAGLVDRG